MDELVAAHPYSIPGPFTSSPDGDHIYAAEGGALALIHADHATWTPSQLKAAYDTSVWRAPVGHMGVTPIEMVLDPDTTWDGITDDHDLVYLAAGRDGLWVMQASENLADPRAFRIDDSGNLDPTTQHGRKWCNDVKVLDLNGDRFLLALFAGRGRSNLRIYNLMGARGVVAAGLPGALDTGHEIAPVQTSFLQKNPAVIAPGANPDAEAYAFGMAIDVESASTAKVYVAMGEHGVFRVPLKVIAGFIQFDGPPREFGPWFGQGSAYENRQLLAGRKLYDTVRYFDDVSPHGETYYHNPYFLDVAVQDDGEGEHRLYATVDHLGWVAFNLDANWDEDIYSAPGPVGTAPGYPDFIQAGWRHQILEAQGPPPVTGGSQYGSPQMNDQIRLVDDDDYNEDQRQTCARHVEIVTTVDHDTEEEFSTLVVSLSLRRFVYDPGRMNEGRVLLADLNLGPVPVADYPYKANGVRDYTLAWDLRHVGDTQYTWKHNDLNAQFATIGGWELHVPEEQPAGELHILYGADIDPNRLYEPTIGPERQNLTRAWRTSWPPGPPNPDPVDHSGFVTRDRFNRLGRASISIGTSKLDPRILVASTNDAGVVSDGPLVFDPAVSKTIEAPFATGGHTTENTPITVRAGDWIPAGQDEALTYGVTMDPKGGFVGTYDQRDYEYRMGFHPRNINFSGESLMNFPDRWRADKWDVQWPGTGVTVHEELWFTPPANKFSVYPYSGTSIYDRTWWSGRPYYNVMSTFEAYNAYVAQNWPEDVDTLGLMFAGVNGSPQGLWAIRMSKLQRELDTPVGSQHLYVPQDYDASLGTASDLFQGTLVTHPEYWNIDDTRTAPPAVASNYFIRDRAAHTLADVQTWYPDMFQLPSSATNPSEMGWVLAVPSGYIALDPSDQVFATHPSWAPDDQEIIDGHRHMMVRIFDVTDPTKIDAAPEIQAAGPNLDSGTLPAVTIIGPAAETSAYIARGVQVTDPGGETRYLLFIGDLSGHLYVYDVAQLLIAMKAATAPAKGVHFGWFLGDLPTVDDAPVATYHTQESLSDSHAHGVYGLEVVHETWTVNSPDDMSATYIYLGVPRIGIEVLKLGWKDISAPQDPPEWIPDLPSTSSQGHGYRGRIQTPGDASLLSVGQVGGGTYLFLADYGGGVRIYENPETGQ